MATSTMTVLEMQSPQQSQKPHRQQHYPQHFELSKQHGQIIGTETTTEDSSQRTVFNENSDRNSNDNNDDRDSASVESAPSTPPPTEIIHSLEHWNKPRGNIYRLGAAFFSMFLCGLNDASYGALLPYLERYYELNYTTVSLVFLFPFVGYTLAAFMNAMVHAKLGQRGIAVITPTCHILMYITLSVHAPWPVIILFSCVGGFGNGLIDGAWSAWAGHMNSGNALEGLLHSCYSLGATFSPLIATSFVTTYSQPWYVFYYLLLGMSVMELVLCATTFWPKNGLAYRLAHPNTSGAEGGRTKQALKNKVTWLCSVWFLIYVGAEVALGGWIVTFMLNVRKGSEFASGISATGFWAGMTVGRAGLGFITEYLSSHTLRFRERFCVTVYLLLALCLQLIFWLVPSFTVSAVAVALLGMFMGPVFPSGIIMATKLLPSEIHVSSIGFSTAFGGTGGAVFPFAVGAIAQAKGVQVLQPIILALLALLTGIWFCFPKVEKKREE